MKYWWIPKAVSVRTEKPFTVITEYETGEIKRLDMTKFIEKSAKLKPLADHPEHFSTAEVNFDDYHIRWEIDSENCVYFHSDYIYEYGESIESE